MTERSPDFDLTENGLIIFFYCDFQLKKETFSELNFLHQYILFWCVGKVRKNRSWKYVIPDSMT